MSKYKRWRELLNRMIVKRQAKKEQTHPVCLHAVEKYEKLKNVNAENDYKTASKKWADKKKTDYLCLNSKKTSSRSFKRVSKK